MIPEDPTDCDTADGRPATKTYAHARLARMLGGDTETIPPEKTQALANTLSTLQFGVIARNLDRIKDRLALKHSTTAQEPEDPHLRVLMGMNPDLKHHITMQRISLICSGAGEFLTQRFKLSGLSLADRLGSTVSACAPAYAVSVLATEDRT
jgi:uncharacterized hydantoinase/oxoprolinase family protein